MARIVATEFVTLDGRIDDPGEWTPAHFDDEIQQLKNEEYFGAAALLFGGTTYNIHAGAWPYVHDEFADRLNSMPKYVAATTADPARWNNTQRIDPTMEDLAALKKDVDGVVLVDGSRQLVCLLLEGGLLDQIDLLVFPELYGRGKTLFADDVRRGLRLRHSASMTSGVVHLVYDVA